MRSQYIGKLTLPDPPEDYCRLIDAANPQVLTRVLSRMPYKHPTWPPTFGEFAALFAEADPKQHAPGDAIDWQKILGEQTDRIVAQHWADWSPLQRRQVTYIGTGNASTGTAFKFTALRVPADPTANKPERIYQFDEIAP